MAVPLRDNTPLPDVRGYYVCSDPKKLETFILRSIEHQKASRIQLHCTAVVKFKDEVVVLHSQNHQHRLIDYAYPDYDLLVEEMFAFVSDPDTFFNIASGGQLVSISSYWALIVKTRQGGVDDEDEDFEDGALNVSTSNKVAKVVRPIKRTRAEIEAQKYLNMDPFLYLLAQSQVKTNVATPAGKRKQLKKKQRDELIFEYLSENNLHHEDSATRINPSTIAGWHQKHSMLNIAVWSNRGINLYHRFIDPDIKWIHFRYSDNHIWSRIQNISKFAGQNKNDTYCDDCNTLHRSTSKCPGKLSVSPPKEDRVLVNSNIPLTKHSCVMYADFEAYQIKEEGEMLGVHVLSGFTLIMIVDGKVTKKKVYSGKDSDLCFFDTVEQFITEYQQEGVQTLTVSNHNNCYKCGKNGKVQGPYRSYTQSKKLVTVHSSCWEFDNAESCVIYFHNFRSYDSHLLLPELIKRYNKIQYLAKSMEKIDSASVTQKHLKFIFKDTCNYLKAPLAKLAKTITQFKFTPQHYRNKKEKEAFPYYWFDSIDKLWEPVPMIQEDWQNELEEDYISISEVKQIIMKKQFHYFKDWHDWYCEKDVWLLAEVFEEFREICFQEQNVDPCYLLGTPSLTWFLAVRMCHNLMYTIKDVEIYQLIQHQIRGGVAQACLRYAKKYENKNEKQEFMYLDVNALYSWCMTQPMPTKITNVFTELPPNWATDPNHIYMILGDFEAPRYPHDSDEYEMYRDMPPMPHRYDNKLCTTFLDKDNYLVSSVVLPFWLLHGITIKKIYKVIQFESALVLKDYVEDNINQRKKFDKEHPKNNFYKLLNNSLYGKTCENKFKYRAFSSRRFEEQEDKNKMQNNLGPNIKKMIKIGEDHVFIETPVDEICLDKPIQLGFTILEYAKLRIYEFWYNVKKEFGRSVQLMYTDTDSLLMVFTVNPKLDIAYEMSQHPNIEKFLDLTTKTYQSPSCRNQTAGFFSSEVKEGEEVVEAVALRAKCYALRKANAKYNMKNKGIIPAAVEENTSSKITMEHYLKVLRTSCKVRVNQHLIQSKDQVVKSIKQNKLALTTLDFKRFVCEDGIKTKPWDDYVLMQNDCQMYE